MNHLVIPTCYIILFYIFSLLSNILFYRIINFVKKIKKIQVKSFDILKKWCFLYCLFQMKLDFLTVGLYITAVGREKSTTVSQNNWSCPGQSAAAWTSDKIIAMRNMRSQSFITYLLIVLMPL